MSLSTRLRKSASGSAFWRSVAMLAFLFFAFSRVLSRSKASQIQTDPTATSRGVDTREWAG